MPNPTTKQHYLTMMKLIFVMGELI